jgi:hypothetical protein
MNMTAPAALPAAPPVTNTAPAEWVQPPTQVAEAVPMAQPAQPIQPAQPPAQNVQPPMSGAPQQQAPVPSAPPAAGGWATPPPPPPSWDTKQHIGATCLVVVHKHTSSVTTKFGIKDVVDVTIIELAGPTPGIIYENEELYNVQLVGQLKGLVGQYTLGRFALGQGKGSQPPIVLNPATEQDGQMAQAWFNANPGVMAELQRTGKLVADQPKPPPQPMQDQWQQPGPMQGQQWQHSPTQGGPQYGQNPYQQQQPYPWQQQGQPTNGQPAWPQPGYGQPDTPPF